MGNMAGLQKPGISIDKLAPRMKEMIESRFPGVFHYDIGPGYFRLLYKDKGVFGFYQYSRSRIGGKHPHSFAWGYWIWTGLKNDLAKEIGARLWDDGGNPNSWGPGGIYSLRMPFAEFLRDWHGHIESETDKKRSFLFEKSRLPPELHQWMS